MSPADDSGLVSPASPDDSGLDMTGDEVKDITIEDCDETDSYITMSDTFSTSTDCDTVKNDLTQDDLEDNDEKQNPPIFKDFYQNCTQIVGIIGCPKN